MQQDPPASLAYDVHGTAAWIRELGLRKVALQLPVWRFFARLRTGAGVHRREFS